MIHVLKQLEQELPQLLLNSEDWQTLDINYEKPHVERVWQQWKQYRVNLHRISPCEFHESFFHPHPWASAMRIVSGRYEMAVGYGRGLQEPPVAATLILAEGSIYEMVDKEAWHRVRPLDTPVMSVMVTDYPWNRAMPKSDKVVLSTLREETKEEILDFFRSKYSEK